MKPAFFLQIVLLISLVLSIGLMLSCEEEISIPEGALEEQIVILDGTWAINKVIRNGVDITAQFDFSGFSLTLNGSGAESSPYQIDNAGVPFPILSDGTWAYDDAVYPTSLTMTSGQDQATIFFNMPPVSTGSELKLDLLLGCSDNVYIYQFNKQ